MYPRHLPIALADAAGWFHFYIVTVLALLAANRIGVAATAADVIVTAVFSIFMNGFWRLLGVRIGHRVFDDGCAIVEKTLVARGDGCTLGAGSSIQCHSLENDTFKSDHTTLGAGCTSGTYAFIHYGMTMEDGTALPKTPADRDR